MNIKRHKPRRGPIVLAISAILLTDCASPRLAVEAPAYSADFLACVRMAVLANEMRPCVVDALGDWAVMSGI